MCSRGLLNVSEAGEEGSARKRKVAGEEVTGVDRGLMMKHLADHSKDSEFKDIRHSDPVLKMPALSVQGSES